MALKKLRKLAEEAVKKARLKKAYKKEGMDKKAAKEKASKKAKAPETGKVRKGAKGVKSTKGGEYVKYGKKSKAAKSFRSAFSEARKAGKSTFTWDGRSYSTAMKGDKKKADSPKPKAPKKASSKEKSGVGRLKRKSLDKKLQQNEALKQSYDYQEGKEPTGPMAGPGFEKKQPEIRARDKAKEGGRVESSGGESNSFGWPSTDARKR